jgi:TnpA family transposase
MIELIDIFKEADLRIGFTDVFQSLGVREQLDRSEIQKRLLLCLYGLGTNMGLKRMATGDVTYDNLLYVKRKFIHPENLKAANIKVVNAILKERLSEVWGKATTSCASDSKKFGAWDQNLMAEWHPRYRGGSGVMIYWHVEDKSVCIHSQLKTCTSSEVAAMIKGLLQHEGLNVVENWNSANSFIFFGRNGEIQKNQVGEQEIAVLSLSLLQNCLVYINTLKIQNIIKEKGWLNKLTTEGELRHPRSNTMRPKLNRWMQPN